MRRLLCLADSRAGFVRRLLSNYACKPGVTVTWLCCQSGAPRWWGYWLARRCGIRAPGKYMRRQRMERAADLLATTDLPVAVVARHVGYRNVPAFCRCFRRWYGKAPSEWRLFMD